MYDKQKVKSSSSILPDESSTNEHLKRSDLQAFIWYQCLKQDIEYPSIKHRGWEETEDGIRPIWFTCPQFPPSLSVTSSRRRLTPGKYTFIYSKATQGFHLYFRLVVCHLVIQFTALYYRNQFDKAFKSFPIIQVTLIMMQTQKIRETRPSPQRRREERDPAIVRTKETTAQEGTRVLEVTATALKSSRLPLLAVLEQSTHLTHRRTVTWIIANEH